MMAPYAYVSATQQWCGGIHLNLNGNLRNMTLTGNSFSGALFGLYSAGVVPVVSSNTFNNCYIAGAMSRWGGDPYLGNPTTWTNNMFTLPPTDNPFTTNATTNAFVVAHYAMLAGYSYATPSLPREVSYPGNTVGLYAKGEPLTA